MEGADDFVGYSYVLIATATDYDCWRVNETPVTVFEVVKTLRANADASRHVTETILEEVHAAVSGGIGTEKGSMQFSIMTAKEKQRAEDRVKLGYILPYFD